VFWYSPVIPWTCCVATIAVTELARKGLKDAAVETTAPAKLEPSTAPTAVAELVR